MRIIANQTFLHDVTRYKEGQSYDVSDMLAGYFIGNGWASVSEGSTPKTKAKAAEVAIQPENGKIR